MNKLPFNAAYAPFKSTKVNRPAHSYDQSKIRWTVFDSSSVEILQNKMREMYWDGVKWETAHILLTLSEWQQPEFAYVQLKDEYEGSMHGFDTFVDQVSQSSRDFAFRCRTL